MMFNLDDFTIRACFLIIAAFVWALIYVVRTTEKELPERRKWLDQLPSIISTLGVLGTFIGITKGLIGFDTSALDQSIPILLDGLKTAFLTSILGMFGSMTLNKFVSAKFDKEKRHSDKDTGIRMLTDAIKSNQSELPRILKKSNEDLAELLLKDNTIQAIRQDVEQLKDDLEEIKGRSKEIENALRVISASNKSIAEELPRLSAVAVTATASLSAIDNNVHDLGEATSSISGNVADVTAQLKTDLQEVLSTLSSIYDLQDEIKDFIADADVDGSNNTEEEEDL